MADGYADFEGALKYSVMYQPDGTTYALVTLLGQGTPMSDIHAEVTIKERDADRALYLAVKKLLGVDVAGRTGPDVWGPPVV